MLSNLNYHRMCFVVAGSAPGVATMSVIIRLQKLPWTANATNIRRFFYGMSIPDGGVHIIGGELGDAFIAFSSDEDARKAMQLTGSRLNEAAVTLQLSSKSEMQTVIAAARGGIAPKAADPAPAASTPASYPATEMSPSANAYRDQRDGGTPSGLGQQPHHNAKPSQPDGRMQRPSDDHSTFVNSPRMQKMPDFMQKPPPPQAFHRPDQERETREPTDGRRPDFGRHPQPMQHDGPRFREEPERDMRRRPDQPPFDRRHGGDARAMGMEGRPPRDQPRLDQEKRDTGRERGQNFSSPINTDNKPRHDVTNNSSGNNSGYDGGPRPMDRNLPGFQRDFSYDRPDPSKQGAPAMNKRDVPQVPNDGRPGRDQAGFTKDAQRFPAGPSTFDTDGRPTMRGPRLEQSGEFGRPMHMNDTVSPRFNRGEGIQRDDRSFDGQGKGPVRGGSRFQGIPPRNAFPQGPNAAPGPVGPDGRNIDHERQDTRAVSKDVDFHSGPGQMPGPPRSSGPMRPGTEFDGRPREMQGPPGSSGPRRPGTEFDGRPGEMQGPPGSSGPRRPGTEFDGRPREMQGPPVSSGPRRPGTEFDGRPLEMQGPPGSSGPRRPGTEFDGRPREMQGTPGSSGPRRPGTEFDGRPREMQGTPGSSGPGRPGTEFDGRPREMQGPPGSSGPGRPGTEIGGQPGQMPGPPGSSGPRRLGTEFDGRPLEMQGPPGSSGPRRPGTEIDGRPLEMQGPPGSSGPRRPGTEFDGRPREMQGPPGSSGPRRPGTEFDGRPREMQQQSIAQPREPTFFGRERPDGETPKFQDGEPNMFEQEGPSVRNGARFDRGGPPMDVAGQGPGMAGRGNNFNAPFPQIGNAMAPGFGRGSPRMGRGRFPPNPEGFGVGRGGSFRDSGRPDIFPDVPMTDTEMPGAGRGGFRRDANAPGFGRGGIPREPDVPDFNKTGAARDPEMPAFGRGGPNRDPNANIGRRGPPGEPPQGRYDAAFKGEMPRFEPGRPPSELGRPEFGRGGPPLDMGMRPPRDFEGSRFGNDGQDLDSRDMDVDRPEVGRGPIGVEGQRFGRGGRNVNVGGHGDPVGPGFERRGPRMEMGDPARYVEEPGFQNDDEGGRPRDPEQSRFGGSMPPMNIDGPGFGMGGPRQDNDRRDIDQGRRDREMDGRHFIDRREGPHDGRPQHNEQMYHRHDAQRHDETMPGGLNMEGRPRQNARPPMKPGLLGDAPGDMIINSGANPTTLVPNLFDEPAVDRWQPPAAEDRDRRRERDDERREPSMRGPSSQSGYQHDEEFRRHDRKRTHGGGDADTCCVHVSGFSRSYNFRDVRRLFRGCEVPRDGLKMTNDRRGQRVGECFMRFMVPSDAEEALSRDGIIAEGRTLHVRICSEYDYEKAIDSFLPGKSDDHVRFAKRPRSRSPTTRQHTEAAKTDTCLAVKNLPHKVTKADLKKFFGTLRLLDQGVHIENHKETSSAYVQMASPRDYPAALNLDKRTLNSRTINVFPISAREFQAQVVSLKGGEAENVVNVVQKVDAKLEVKKKAPVTVNTAADRSVKQEKKTVIPAKQPAAPVANSTCVKMTGLPSTANGAMVKEFFEGLQLATRGINIIYNKDQTATGIAFVEFASAPECEKALKKNRTSMGDSSCVYLETIAKGAMQTQMAVENARCRGEVPEAKKAPLIPTLTPRTMPEQRKPEQRKPAQLMPAQRIPEQRTPAQRIPEQRTPAPRMPAQRMPEQRTPEQQRLQGQRMPEQRVQEQRMPEQPLQEKQMPEQPIQEEAPQEQRQGFAIRVRNAPYRATERDMHGFFMCCGPVPGSVKIQRAPNGMPTGDVLIAFHNPADARRAVTDLHGRYLMGRSLMISLD